MVLGQYDPELVWSWSVWSWVSRIMGQNGPGSVWPWVNMVLYDP